MEVVKPKKLEKYKSYIGQNFNSLKIIDVSYEKNLKTKDTHYFFICKCDCGNTTKVRVKRVLNGETQTCGCRNKGYNYHNSDGLSKNYPHLYSVWNILRHKCYNKNNAKYKNYGARGITVCEEWKHKFEPFCKWAMANGYRQGLTIERIDVDGNYEPSNCKWITFKEQSRNKTNTKYAIYNGIKKPLIVWCEELNLPYNTIRARIDNSWEVNKALETPIKHLKRK